jgi:3-oxoacyl-[acyl-carrier protein] reductase
LKAGVFDLTKSMAIELASYGLRVNAIAPGPTDNQAREIGAATPFGRIGHPDDIAAAVCFLASPENVNMTGQTHHVNGGLFMP